MNLLLLNQVYLVLHSVHFLLRSHDSVNSEKVFKLMFYHDITGEVIWVKYYNTTFTYGKNLAFSHHKHKPKVTALILLVSYDTSNLFLWSIVITSLKK